MEETLKTAIQYYGPMNQKIMAIEEMSELIKEVTKDMRTDSAADKKHIAEEIADVEIAIQQLKMMYDIEDKQLIQRKYEKIERLKQRMAKDKS